VSPTPEAVLPVAPVPVVLAAVTCAEPAPPLATTTVASKVVSVPATLLLVVAPVVVAPTDTV